MIKVPNINGKPETIPNTSFGVYSDETHFYFFESDGERIAHLESLNVFDFNLWKSEANALHNELFTSYYSPLKYEGEADIALTALNSAQYAEEALKLSKWRNDTFDLIEAVTEDIAQQMTPQDFINQLPIFDVSKED